MTESGQMCLDHDLNHRWSSRVHKVIRSVGMRPGINSRNIGKDALGAHH